MNPKEKDDEIIELTDEELDEIFADDDFDNGEEGGEIRSFYFSNPDPYAKVKPRPDDAPKREFSFDEKGSIVVKNPSAFWLPDVKIVEEHSGKDDPLNSIQHQQIMLMEYAKSQHFPNPTFFIDDGYSGVDFSNRPGFQKMLAEIEAGHVEVVITKDLSRLGRNSSLTGLYINYTFPQYGVRYIAINDHFDTIDPNSKSMNRNNRQRI